MKMPHDQLLNLLINNPQPVWEIEAVYKRCCIYYGEDYAIKKCEDVIYFATMANIPLLESFRLHIEIEELAINRINR